MAGINKVLVANRGEIACRVFRSARALGLSTVAVYSEADAASLHVDAADEAVAIGPSSPRESYLNASKILEAALRVGADAIHPGYGFLAENAAFAELVTAKGLHWIGPTADIIRRMGDKQRARDIARAAGVPVVPGSRTFDVGDTDGLEAAGRAVGYPLLVKAVGGGGGIGMRRVDDDFRLASTVIATQSMAEKSFGNGAIFLERFVPRSRHIEIQVFGFGNSEAVHLFERDCSVQRRFQKVIEESPAPGLPEAVRRRMGEAAVSLCAHTRYGGAGTVEFIVDANSFEFFFLEMNTRIQVEHPVTEMVTGVDLVAMQIDFARGQLTGADQESIRSVGHAIECRLYAENPAKMFMPAPGPLTIFEPPAETEHVRVDSGYREGDVMTPFYDPLIAKLIVHGRDRLEACERAEQALRNWSIDGLRTNRDFLIGCLRNGAFRAGDVHTSFLDEHAKAILAA